MFPRSLLLFTAFAAGLFLARFVEAQDLSGSSSRSPISEATGVAVVELFTSQGCSSCPPADRVLTELAETATGDQPVYLLSFHVDYWNSLGWKDPYSLPISSGRQRAYARSWSSKRVYTPQMVVNGRREFNGGNQRKAKTAIAKELQQAAQADVRLTLEPSSDAQTLDIQYQIDGQIDDCLLNIAVVTNKVSNSVPRGENRGRELVHVNVVRAFNVSKLEQSAGTMQLSLPDDVAPADAQVIGYVQRRADASVIGAAAIPAESIAAVR